jgi:hypothetical protein
LTAPGCAGLAQNWSIWRLGRLKTSEATQIAREWVARYAAEHPDFCAAHLMGGVTHMAPDEEFPPESDLDLMLVTSGPTKTKDPLDEPYRGLAIEAGLRGMEEYETPEKVLANPEIADHIAVGAILIDPHGLLAALQPTVAREFSRRRWVKARCEEEKRRYEMGIAAAGQSRAPMEALVLMTLAIHNLASVLPVAQLIPPTHRKSLVLLGRQLAALARTDIYEEMLQISGVAGLAVQQVQSYADHLADAFDRAIQVHRTSVPFDFKVRPHLRPYLIDGSQSLIDAGHHREAMPWISAGIFVCSSVLLVDAPASERPRYEALVDDLLYDTGFGDGAMRARRLIQANHVKESLYALADEVIARWPDELITA